MLEDVGKCLEVARVAALLASHPVFGAPEQVGIEGPITTRIQCEPLVVGIDQVLRQATVHREALRPNQVWSADITYVPIQHGFMYLVAILDWFSHSVLAWQLANTLDGRFCLEALEQALLHGQPNIFNTDQGVQFTALEFTNRLATAGVRMSIDGRGRALDNIFIERLWRLIKYEDIYLKDYASVPELDAGLHAYFQFYNTDRPHQSLNYRTPAEIHFT
jgi:putative transposase